MITTKEYCILILCREIGLNVKIMSNYFSKKQVNYRIIVDNNCKNKDKYKIYFNDNELLNNKFNGLTLLTKKDPCSWDKSFYYLKDNLEFKFYYFIEDDVFCDNPNVFLNLFEEMNKHDEDFISRGIFEEQSFLDWPHWTETIIRTKNRYRSFNPFCRISSVLIKDILNFRDQNNKFDFHETLFASLCVDKGMSFLDYDKDKELNAFFGNFSYRFNGDTLTFAIKNKINHPVKKFINIR